MYGAWFGNVVGPVIAEFVFTIIATSTGDGGGISFFQGQVAFAVFAGRYYEVSLFFIVVVARLLGECE